MNSIVNKLGWICYEDRIGQAFGAKDRCSFLNSRVVTPGKTMRAGLPVTRSYQRSKTSGEGIDPIVLDDHDLLLVVVGEPSIHVGENLIQATHDVGDYFGVSDERR